MADFSFLTDSEDEKAVEDVLSQAMDHSVLEQVASINCSSFSSSDLPSHLESRFRKLKSFPATTAAGSRFPPSKCKSFKPQFDGSVPGFHDSGNVKEIPDEEKGIDLKSSDGNPKDEVFKEEQDEKKGLKEKSGSGSSKSHSNSSAETKEFYAFKQNPDEKLSSKSKSLGFRSKSPTDSWGLSSAELESGSESESLSPPQKSGCFWCSLKKTERKTVYRKKGKENWLSSSGTKLDWGKDDEILSGLRTFSVKEHQKILQKAMKEEEKINRETEKIVKWAKQASARMMDVSGLDDELSDFETNTK